MGTAGTRQSKVQLSIWSPEAFQRQPGLSLKGVFSPEQQWWDMAVEGGRRGAGMCAVRI